MSKESKEWEFPVVGEMVGGKGTLLEVREKPQPTKRHYIFHDERHMVELRLKGALVKAFTNSFERKSIEDAMEQAARLVELFDFGPRTEAEIVVVRQEVVNGYVALPRRGTIDDRFCEFTFHADQGDLPKPPEEIVWSSKRGD